MKVFIFLEVGGGGEGGVCGLGGIFFGIFGWMKLRLVMVKFFNLNDLVVLLLVFVVWRGVV